MAHAESSEPDHSTIVRVAQKCTAQGAFGHRFGEKSVEVAPPADVPPFFLENLSSTRRDDAVFEITAAASFAHALMSNEDRIAMATWVFRALDKEVSAEHRFAKRIERRDGVLYASGDGFTFDLSHDGTKVRLTCTSIALKQRAQEEMRYDVEP